MRLSILFILLLLAMAYIPADWMPLPGGILTMLLYGEMSRPT